MCRMVLTPLFYEVSEQKEPIILWGNLGRKKA